MIYEKAIYVNYELKLNIDEQQDDIQHLTKQCDINNDNEVQEITAAITPMKRKACKCAKIFKM